MRGFKTMYDYRGKVAGMVIAAVGSMLVIIQKLAPFNVFRSMNAEQHYYLSAWITVVGLFSIAFSMEKHEDERVKKIRAGAMQLVIGLLIGLLLALSFTGIVIGDFDLAPEMLIAIAGFYLVFYLVVFHIGLYTDILWQYDADEIPIVENIKKNWWVHLVVVIVMMGVLLLIFSII